MAIARVKSDQDVIDKAKALGEVIGWPYGTGAESATTGKHIAFTGKPQGPGPQGDRHRQRQGTARLGQPQHRHRDAR